MPEPTIEPEKYSIDEMMGRLKSRSSSEDGELVTRSDGSQAIKVRKRKRRTSQKGDKLVAQNHRLQLFQIAGFIIFLVVLLLLGGLGIIFVNSPGFRESLVSKVEERIGGEVKIDHFRMNPANANAAKVTMQWPEGHVLERLEIYSAKAEVSPVSFLGKEFQGEEIVASKGFLSLKRPGERNASKSSELPKGEIDFDRYSVPQLDLFFGKERRWDRMLRKTEASFYPGSGKNQGQIRLSKGILTFGNWPELELDRSYINIRDNQLHVRSMRFQIPRELNEKSVDVGSIDFTGVISPLEPDTTHSLTVSLDSFKLGYLLGEDLKQLFTGEVVTVEKGGPNVLRFAPAEESAISLELNFSNALDSQIVISEFKFLSLLAQVLDDRWYETPGFDSQVGALVQRSDRKVNITNISFEKRGRMALRGNLSSQEGGALSGRLQVGIPGAILGIAKNKRIDMMFSPAQGGYRWVDLEIGGTGAVPQDNFKQLYNAAVPLEADGEAGEALEENAVDTFDSLIDGR